MSPSKLLAVAGTRPDFTKITPLMREFASCKSELNAVLVHTGQYNGVLDLELNPPSYNLQVGGESHAVQTAEILKRFEPVVERERPDAVIVIGDADSALGCALTAKKMGVPVVHIEAGMRSFDRSAPEEINRLAIDAISDLLLVTEETGLMNLVREGASRERVRFVGNLTIDSLRFHLKKACLRDTRERFGVSGNAPYGVVTLDRASNVNDARVLDQIVAALSEISRELPLLFSVDKQGIILPDGIRMTGPLRYLDLVALMDGSAVVLTDSAGIQDETTALGVPCLTLGENTERPITISQGTNVIAGTTRTSILEAWRAQRAHPKAGRIPELWDGFAAERCTDAIADFLRAPNRALPVRQAA